MKIRLVILLLALYTLAWGQPAGVQEIRHTYFTSYFSPAQHIPLVIRYDLKRSMVACPVKTVRSNKFAKDPDYPLATDLKDDYKYSGYDKGHNMPAADNACDATGMKECFYFSNMTPQPHYFNAGVWKSLETRERQYALTNDITIFTGSIGRFAAIGADSVVVPEYMWKVIYFPGNAEEKYECYLFPNTSFATPPYTKYKVPLHEIEERAEICFTEGRFAWRNATTDSLQGAHHR